MDGVGKEPPTDSPMVCATCGEPAACYHTDGRPFCTAHCALGHRIEPRFDSRPPAPEGLAERLAYTFDVLGKPSGDEPPFDCTCEYACAGRTDDTDCPEHGRRDEPPLDSKQDRDQGGGT